MPRTSVIITNHNHGRFVGQAIDSALNQSGGDVEVIVVDDGSTDDSRRVIASFGDRVHAVLKPRGGQASAINAGFDRSAGAIVLLLDADDVLLPHAVERASVALAADGCSKVHWAMEVIDDAGTRLHRRHPTTALPSGDCRADVIARGPWMCENPPTSGNAWSRSFLERVLPIPEADFALCADAYLLALAPLFGPIGRIDEPLSNYRIHAANHYWNRPFEQQLTQSMAIYESQCAVLGRWLCQQRIAHDAHAWTAHSWWHRLAGAVELITAHVPEGDAFALADQDLWGTPTLLRGRRRVAFPGFTGQFTGNPVDDTHAVALLDELASGGPAILAIGWPAAWYRDVYPGFARRLTERWRRVADHPAVSIHQLR